MRPSQIINRDRSWLLPSHTLIPMNHVTVDAVPVFVNCKQYEAILRRREKKRKLASQAACLKKHKYKSRSLHAQRRARTGDGKFLGKKRTAADRTAATEESPRESRRPAVQSPCGEADAADKWPTIRKKVEGCRGREEDQRG